MSSSERISSSGDKLSSRRTWVTDAVVKAPLAGLAAGQILDSSGFGPDWAARAADSPKQGLPASGYFNQHAVLLVNDMEANIKFWRDGLGMKVVRDRTVGADRNVFMAYGAETLATKSGGYFSLELATASKPVYDVGTAFQYFGIVLPEKLMTIASRVEQAGGQIVPHWFLEKDFVELRSPEGVSVRVSQGKRRDPFAVLALGTNDLRASSTYFKKSLKMKEQGSLLQALGALKGDSAVLGYDKEAVLVSLNKIDRPVTAGELFVKLAILTRDVMAEADVIAADPFGKVIFAGPVPGIGTKVANTIDKEFHGVVFVDYDDFEKEQTPSSA